jgi:hypothetical protein
MLQEQTLNAQCVWLWPLQGLSNSVEAGNPYLQLLQLAVMPGHQHAGTAAAGITPNLQSPSTCAHGRSVSSEWTTWHWQAAGHATCLHCEGGKVSDTKLRSKKNHSHARQMRQCKLVHYIDSIHHLLRR